MRKNFLVEKIYWTLFVVSQSKVFGFCKSNAVLVSKKLSVQPLLKTSLSTKRCQLFFLKQNNLPNLSFVSFSCALIIYVSCCQSCSRVWWVGRPFILSLSMSEIVPPKYPPNFLRGGKNRDQLKCTSECSQNGHCEWVTQTNTGHSKQDFGFFPYLEASVLSANNRTWAQPDLLKHRNRTWAQPDLLKHRNRTWATRPAEA